MSFKVLKMGLRCIINIITAPWLAVTSVKLNCGQYPESKCRSSDKQTASLGQETFVCSREWMCISIRLKLLPQLRTSLCSVWWWGQGEREGLRGIDGTMERGNSGVMS